MQYMDKSTLSAYDSASAKFAQEWRGQPAPEDMYALRTVNEDNRPRPCENALIA